MIFNSVERFMGVLVTSLSTVLTLKAGYAFILKLFTGLKPGMHLFLDSNYCSSLCDISEEITGEDAPERCKGKLKLYLDVSIRSVGTKDIRLCDKNEYVYLTCTDKYRWLTIDETISNPRIVYTSKKHDDQDIRFTWHLLKRGEKIRMKLFAECSDPNQENPIVDFLETLRFESRKANLITHSDPYLELERKQAKTRYWWFGSLGLICAFVGVVLFFSDIQLGANSPLNGRQGVVYDIQDQQQAQETKGIIRYKDNEHIKVLFDPKSEDRYNKNYPISEFNNEFSIKGIDSIIVYKNLVFKIIGVLLTLSGLIIMAINALRLWALGNRKREEKYRLWFFQGKSLHMFD